MNFRLKPIPYYVILCAILFDACTSQRKIQATAPSLPDSLETLPPSQIDIPIKINAKPILLQAEFMVPKEFYSDAWPNYTQSGCDFRYKYHFTRSPLHISCINNQFHVQFIGSYQIAGSKCICAMDKPATPWISGSCGFGNEEPRKSDISISSQLHFLPSYHVLTVSRAEKVEAIDKCQVSVFSSDVTQLVMDSIRSSVNFFCNSLDQTISGFDLGPITRQLSNLSYHSVSVGKYGYVLLNPSAIRFGQINYAQDTLSFSVGLTCSPGFSSDSLSAPGKSILPPLTALHANRDDVTLYTNSVYSYGFLSKLFTDTLRDKVFTLKGRTIVVKEVAVKGLGHHMVEIRIDFAGSNKGTIYLRGTPVLDSAKQSLSIPDISYTLDSKDLLLNIGKSLFRNKINKSLKGNSYLDIAALVKTNMSLINQQVNRALTNSLSVAGQVNSVRLLGLLARDNDIQMQMFVGAHISILSSGILK